MAGERGLLAEDIHGHDARSSEVQRLVDVGGEAAIVEQEAEVIGIRFERISVTTYGVESRRISSKEVHRHERDGGRCVNSDSAAGDHAASDLTVVIDRNDALNA